MESRLIQEQQICVALDTNQVGTCNFIKSIENVGGIASPLPVIVAGTFSICWLHSSIIFYCVYRKICWLF